MVDKVFGADFTNEANPLSAWTISVHNGTELVDVTLGNLLKAIFPDGDYGDFSTISQVFTLDTGVVNAGKIASDAITTAKILDANVTLAKLVNASGQYKIMGRSSASAGVWQEISSSADVFSILVAADFAAVRTLLGLVIGTNVQAWDADLDTWAGKTAPSGAVLGTTDTQTVTNKRVTPRPVTVTAGATPSINSDNGDFFEITGLTVDITSMTTNLSGTPTNAQKMWIAITGTAARAITWGASFEAGAVALPTTTVTTQRLDVFFVWNAVTSKWRCMASGSA